MMYCSTFIIDGKCSACHSDVEQTDKYCHECGRRLWPGDRINEEADVDRRHFEMYRRWLDGAERKAIAEEFGVSNSTVALVVRSTVPRKHWKMPDDIKERIESMTGIEPVGTRVDWREIYERIEKARKG